ncbi:MAG: hypothetical protein ABFC96_04605 [Thermoguttaceae bacterium]
MLGVGLSVGLWVAGSVIAVVGNFYAGIPYGYTRITYEMLQPDPQKPTEPIPQTAMDMRDKKVFMQGYMQPSRRQTGIKEFVLQPTNGECPFCMKNPKPTEKVRIVLQGDLETTFTTHLVNIAGRFSVDPENAVPYALEADYLR